jgi:phosphoglucomutase
LYHTQQGNIQKQQKLTTMTFIEITDMTDKELELLFAQKELEINHTETEQDSNDWLGGDFEEFTFEALNAELTEEQKEKIALENKIEVLKAEVEAERVAAINAQIEANNEIIEELQTKIAGLKETKAGRSFVNFYTGKSQFMTFTQINAAKLQNQITNIKNENKELEAQK